MNMNKSNSNVATSLGNRQRDINDDWEEISNLKSPQNQTIKAQSLMPAAQQLHQSNLPEIQKTTTHPPNLKPAMNADAPHADVKNDQTHRPERDPASGVESGRHVRQTTPLIDSADASIRRNLASHKVGDLSVCVASLFSSDEETQESVSIGLSALGSPPCVEEISSILAAQLPRLPQPREGEENFQHRPFNAFREPVAFIKCDSMDGFTQISLDRKRQQCRESLGYSYLDESPSPHTSESMSGSHELDESYENVHQSLLQQKLTEIIDNTSNACNFSRAHAAPSFSCGSNAALTDSCNSSSLNIDGDAIALPSSPNSRTYEVTELEERVGGASFAASDSSLASCSQKHASKSNEFIRLPLQPTLRTCSNRDSSNAHNFAASHHGIDERYTDRRLERDSPRRSAGERNPNFSISSSPQRDSHEFLRAGSIETTVSLSSESSRLNYTLERSRGDSIELMSSDNRSENIYERQAGHRGGRNKRRNSEKDRSRREMPSGEYERQENAYFYERECVSPRHARHANLSYTSGRAVRSGEKSTRHRESDKLSSTHHLGSKFGIEKDRGGGHRRFSWASFFSLKNLKSICKKVLKITTIVIIISYALNCIVLVIYNIRKCRLKFGGDFAVGIHFDAFLHILPFPAVDCGGGIARLEQIIEIGTALGNTLISREDIILEDYYEDLENLLLEFKEMDLSEISNNEVVIYQRQKNYQRRVPCESEQAAEQLKSGELPISCRSSIIEGLAHINNTLQTIFTTVQYFRIGVMSASGRIARGLEIVENQLDRPKVVSFSWYMEMFNFSPPDYKELVSAFSQHLYKEVKSIQSLAVSIYNQLEVTSERAGKTLELLRKQLDILLNAGEDKRRHCYALDVFDGIGGRLLRIISETLGYKLCDESDNREAERMYASKNLTSALLLRAENQALKAHGVIAQVLKKLQSFELMLRTIEERPLRFLSYYSAFYREEKSVIIERVKNLRIFFQEQSGEHTPRIASGRAKMAPPRRGGKVKHDL